MAGRWNRRLSSALVSQATLGNSTCSSSLGLRRLRGSLRKRKEIKCKVTKLGHIMAPSELMLRWESPQMYDPAGRNRRYSPAGMGDPSWRPRGYLYVNTNVSEYFILFVMRPSIIGKERNMIPPLARNAAYDSSSPISTIEGLGRLTGGSAIAIPSRSTQTSCLVPSNACFIGRDT